MFILAIDPGDTQSAYCVIDAETYKPYRFDKVDNNDMISIIELYGSIVNKVAIEMVASYGMPVGREVFNTCVWIGRFIQKASGMMLTPDLVYRAQEKLNICKSPKANDATIRKALIDRFAKHDLKNGKGTKKNPDWFYNFRADIWAAYAVGVTFLDNTTIDMTYGGIE